MLSGFLTSMQAKPPRCAPGILIVARSVSGQGSSAESWICAFQRHRYVPLDEIYLTVPLSPWNGSSPRLDLIEETAHFARKPWICASGFWDSEFARRLRGLQGHGYVPLDEIYFTMPLIRFR